MAEKALAEKAPELRDLLASANIKSRFTDILGKKAPAFMSSIITLAANNKLVEKCEPMSVIAASSIAASLDLPIVPSLGQAAIVPYKTDDVYLAQFQIMWRGVVQLAHRSKQYKHINLARVYEGQLIHHNRFTEEVKLEEAKRVSDRVMGFYFMFELLTGFRKEFYWSAQRCVDHGYRYSKSFQYGNGKWIDDPLITMKNSRFDAKAFKGLLTEGSGAEAMGAKTVVKNELLKWGPLSSDMQTAFEFDQAAVTPEGKPRYIDTTTTDDEKKNETYALPKAKGEGAAPQAQTAAAGQAPKDAPDTVVIDSVARKLVDGAERATIRIGERKLLTDDKGIAKYAEAAAKDKAPVFIIVKKVGSDEWLEAVERAP